MNSVANLVQSTSNPQILSKAQDLEASGACLEAISFLEESAKQSKSPEEIYCAIGRLSMKLENKEKAEENAIEALKANPEFRAAYMLLGEILEANGGRAEATSCYTFVLPNRINQKYFKDSVSVIDSTNSVSTERLLAYPAEPAIRLHDPKSLSTDSEDDFNWEKIQAGDAYIDVLEKGKIWFDEFNIVVSDKENNVLGNHTIGNNNLIGSAMSVSKPQKHKGRVMALVARGSGIYYHWMIDILPGLAALRASGISISSIDKFIVHGPVNNWHLETLAHFGIKKAQVVKARHERFIEADELIVPFFRNGMGSSMGSWIPEFLNQEFGSTSNENSGLGRRLYLTRAVRGSRGIENEEDLARVLTERGFEAIACENFSREEQAELMSQADVVVAPHGAALTNIVYCRPGTKIIEFYGSHISPAYWAISRLCKLDYYSHFCFENEDNRSPSDVVKHAKTRVERMGKGYPINADEISDLLDYAAVY